MDHLEAHEALELAALEPGGLERLAAGDTPQAAAFASHLLGCDRCVDELDRLRRLVPQLRLAISESPPPDLRSRTLAYVRERGRPRTFGTDRLEPAAADSTTPESRTQGPEGDLPPPVQLAQRREGVDRTAWRVAGRHNAGWLLAVAAAVVVAAVAGGLVVDSSRSADLRRAEAVSTELVRLNVATTEILATADVRQVTLFDASNTVRGTLLLAPASGSLVVTATGLTPPATGAQYRCWVDSPAGHRVLGVMRFAAGLAYWSGSAYSLSELPAGTQFGVTLVPAGASSGTLMLHGSL